MRRKGRTDDVPPPWVKRIRGWGDPEWPAEYHYRVWLSLRGLWQARTGVDPRTVGDSPESDSEPPTDILRAAQRHAEHLNSHRCGFATWNCEWKPAAAWLPR